MMSKEHYCDLNMGQQRSVAGGENVEEVGRIARVLVFL